MTEWITFLEMVERPVNFPTVPEDFQIALAEKNGRINLDWYRRVGARWAWTDRLKWSEEEWRGYVESENLETWIASFQGQDCGYFELSRQDEGVRIALLGLAPESIGKGLGGSLLSKALERAWTEGIGRVFLDTCSKDHPNALPTYLRNGFRIIRTEYGSR
ncbi:GNAT family N-acetyltransferase [Akkermansiaceae bacterium]|nr:GNAT family N-acetyltransferase [Akkermansiaceae bacterium]